MNKWIRKAGNWFFANIPGKPYLVFESQPLYADNTRAVYDEMIRRELYKKYKLIWVTPNVQEKTISIPHSKVIYIRKSDFCNKLYRYSER